MQPDERKGVPSSPQSPKNESTVEVEDHLPKNQDLPAGTRLLTTAQFSQKYGLGFSTIYHRIQTGKLKSVRKPGGGKQRLIVDPGWEHYTIPNHDCTPSEEIHVLNGKEVAELLGCSPRWVRYMATRGELGFSKTSTKARGHRRFSISDVRKMIAIRALGKRRPSRVSVRTALLQWAKERLGAS